MSTSSALQKKHVYEADNRVRESARDRDGVGIKIETKFVTFASLLQPLVRDESPHLNEMKLRCRNTTGNKVSICV